MYIIFANFFFPSAYLSSIAKPTKNSFSSKPALPAQTYFSTTTNQLPTYLPTARTNQFSIKHKNYLGEKSNILHLPKCQGWAFIPPNCHMDPGEKTRVLYNDENGKDKKLYYPTHL